MAIGDHPYQGNYELLPKDNTFRAPIVTPKPLVYGPQTAKVVARSGKDGEEIDVDDDGHGRIKVRFHWDRDDKRSCWVRVAQMWAGGQWGGHFIPRIGMEVVVEFLEGDPDRPLVVGAVYNGDNKFPYKLPDKKTQSGIKSNSSKGGNGYNELMFEDAKNSEAITLHAQKDLNSTILHAETREIGNNFESPSGLPSRTTTLKNGDDELEISAGNQNVHIKQKQTVVVDNDITITSMTTITLQVGSNNVVIDQSGVHITGMTIDLKGNAAINETAPMIKLN